MTSQMFETKWKKYFEQEDFDGRKKLILFYNFESSRPEDSEKNAEDQREDLRFDTRRCLHQIDMAPPYCVIQHKTRVRTL